MPIIDILITNSIQLKQQIENATQHPNKIEFIEHEQGYWRTSAAIKNDTRHKHIQHLIHKLTPSTHTIPDITE